MDKKVHLAKTRDRWKEALRAAVSGQVKGQEAEHWLEVLTLCHVRALCQHGEDEGREERPPQQVQQRQRRAPDGQAEQEPSDAGQELFPEWERHRARGLEVLRLQGPEVSIESLLDQKHRPHAQESDEPAACVGHLGEVPRREAEGRHADKEQRQDQTAGEVPLCDDLLLEDP